MARHPFTEVAGLFLFNQCSIFFIDMMHRLCDSYFNTGTQVQRFLSPGGYPYEEPLIVMNLR